jgi:iron complex transport system substrate-binding protein
VQQRLAGIPVSRRKRVIQLRSEGAFYAPDNSFGDVCRHAGVSDATLELKYPSAMEITQEKVVELNPDIIFVPDWDYDGKHNPDGEKQKILNNPSYSGMKAVQQGKVYTISGALVLTVSQYIADAVEEVAKMSYPEVFGKS